jgi:SAM-dependent methyltransferase
MSELYLNLGAGGNILPPPWQNFDLNWDDPKLRVDITKPLPWPDNSVDRILLEHVVEHCSGPDALRCLMECHRILKLGGVLRVCVPCICFDGANAIDLILNHGHLIFFSEDSLCAVLFAAGFVDNKSLTGRAPEDGHWKVIGKEADDEETLRMEAIK